MLGGACCGDFRGVRSGCANEQVRAIFSTLLAESQGAPAYRRLPCYPTYRVRVVMIPHTSVARTTTSAAITVTAKAVVS